MSTVEQQVKAIVAEQLGVKAEQVVNDASFVDDLGAACAEFQNSTLRSLPTTRVECDEHHIVLDCRSVREHEALALGEAGLAGRAPERDRNARRPRVKPFR